MGRTLPPDDELERLRILADYAILDTPSEARFDEVVEIAAAACGTPIALISLVDHRRQWFKAERGMGVRETSRDVAICAHAMREPGLFVVEDLLADPRFRDNPLVRAGDGLRFYAGVPLLSPEGHALGTLCVMDRVPRSLDGDRRALLGALARQVMAQFELGRMVRALSEARRTSQRNEAFLRATLDALTDHIAITDAQGRIVDTNSAWDRFAMQNARGGDLVCLGVGANYLEVCARAAANGAARAAEVGEAIRAVLRGEAGAAPIEYPCHGPGERRWFIFRVSGLLADGARYAVVAHQNITARKLAEEAVTALNNGLEARVAARTSELERANRELRASASRLSAIFDNAAVGFAVSGPDGRLDQVNRAFCDIVGREEDRLIGSTIRSFVHPEDWTELQSVRRAVLAGEISDARIELRYLRPGGELIWVHSSIAALPDGDSPRAQVVALVQDVTRRRRAEHERDRFFRLSVDLFAIMDADGTIRSANPALTRILGYEVSEVLGRPYTEFIDAADRARVMQDLASLAESPVKRYLDLRLRTKSGDLRILRWSAALWRQERSYVLVGRDITEHEQANARVRDQRAQLRALAARLQSSREEERLAISREVHDELGQMLTALKMDLTLLAREIDAGMAVEALQDELKSIRALVDETLERMRRFARSLRPELLDTLGLVAAVEAHAGEFEARTGIRTEVCADGVPEDISQALGTALFRIAQEALTNVARHSRASRARVELSCQGDVLTLSVIDNGRGIRADELEARESLGLLGMRERALAVGGTLEVGALETGGTRLRVRLPAARREP